MVDKTRIPVSTATLERLLARFPRISLGQFPTPLEEVPRFSGAVGGPRILIKREDLSGLAFGGNKTRQLEYLLGTALETGVDVVVTGAAAQSNMCRQTTAACAKLGLDVHLILRKVRGDTDEVPQGNLLLDHLMGADVALVEMEAVSDQRQMILGLAEKLRQEGRTPYVPHYQDGYLAAIAYADCMLETTRQLEEKGVEAKYVYVASGNYTYSGLLMGAKALGTPVEVRGFPSGGGAEKSRSFVATLVNEASERLGLALTVAAGDAFISDEYVGAGYGIPTNEGIVALKLLARTEGILLDPVYTCKAMSGLIDHARRGELGAHDTVVFIHTGGNPAIFAYSDILTTWVSTHN